LLEDGPNPLTSIKVIDILKIYKFTTAIKKQLIAIASNFRSATLADFDLLRSHLNVRQEKLTTPAWHRLA
jgi:hypothetical protein